MPNTPDKPGGASFTVNALFAKDDEVETRGLQDTPEHEVKMIHHDDSNPSHQVVSVKIGEKDGTFYLN